MEGIKDAEKQNAARDTYKIAYIIHFFLGAGNLLPWNAFITAVDYFGYLYPGKHVEQVFSIAYMGSSVFMLLLMIMTLRWSRRRSFQLRMNVGFSMFVLSLMVAPMVDWVWCRNKNERPSWTYVVAVVAVVVCGLADGLIGGSLIGSAGRLPKEYMQGVFAGTASSGVLVCMLRIITKASLPQSPQGLQASAHFYFILSSIILLGCLVSSNLLFALPVMQQHYKKLKEDDSPVTMPELWNTATKILCPAFGIFSIYTVTLSIFPGFIADDQQSKILRDWYPIMLITVYNVSDLLGKSSTGLYVPRNIGKATWACVGRILFYPLFQACLHGPKWLDSEASVVFLTFMLGITNGYLTSVLMILTPKSVPTPEAETAAIVMAVFLGLGLVGGSVFGWLWII